MKTKTLDNTSAMVVMCVHAAHLFPFPSLPSWSRETKKHQVNYELLQLGELTVVSEFLSNQSKKHQADFGFKAESQL